MAKATERFIPRFQLLVDELREQIRSGSISSGNQFPSERQLGLNHNVSRQTVRRALKILQTEGLITSAAGKGSFVQTPPASPVTEPIRSAITPTRSPQIGFIFDNQLILQEHGMSQTLLGFMQVFSSMGYGITLSSVSRDEKNLVYPVYRRWLKDGSMDGYILSSVPSKVQEIFHSEANAPVINMGYVWSETDIPSLEADFRAIYRNIVMVLADRGLLPFYTVVPAELVDRETAFFFNEVISGHREGLLAAGLSPTQGRLVKYRQDSGYEVVMSLRRAIRQNGPPRAIVVEPQHLTHILTFLKKSGLRVNEDVTIVSTQGLPEGQADRLPVAFYEQDRITLARRAAEKLQELIETGTTQPRRELITNGGLIFPEDRIPLLDQF